MKKRAIISLLLVCSMLLASVLPMTASAADTIDFVPEVSNGRVYGIPVGSDMDDVQIAFYNAVVAGYDRNGNAISNTARIGTGYTLRLNGVAYAAVVMGDVNGDAILDSLDYLAVKRCFLGTATLDTLGREAADAPEGTYISALHYIKVKRAAFGTYDINIRYTVDPYNPGDGDPGWTPGWV